MRFGGLAVLTALILAVGVLNPVPASASDSVSISLRIPGEAPLLNGNVEPVMVAGLWHDLSLNLESPVQGRLILEASALGSQADDMSSHYRWERDEANGIWSEPLYGFFLEPELSSSEGQAVTFRMGIDATAIPGEWELEIVQDGASVGQHRFEVREARIGYGLSSADFNLRAEPFKQAEIYSEDEGQYLRVINHGNVPLRLSASFDRLQSRISFVNPTDVAHINDNIRYFLKVDLDPRPPQVIRVNAITRVEPIYLIPSPGAAQIIPAIEGEFNLQVIVGRSGYAVETVGNVVFQTLNGLSAAFGSLVTWQVYLTGDQTVSLDAHVVDAQLLGILRGEELLSLPAVLTPTPNAELPLTIQVQTTVPSALAEVIFTITVLDTGEVSTYRTTIDVGERPPSPPLQPSLLWFFASLISASVLAITTYNHWRFTNLGATGLRLRNRSKFDKDSRGRSKAQRGDNRGAAGKQAKASSQGKTTSKRKSKGKGNGK